MKEVGFLGRNCITEKKIQFSQRMGKSTVLELRKYQREQGQKERALDLFLLIASWATGYLLYRWTRITSHTAFGIFPSVLAVRGVKDSVTLHWELLRNVFFSISWCFLPRLPLHCHTTGCKCTIGGNVSNGDLYQAQLGLSCKESCESLRPR